MAKVTIEDISQLTGLSRGTISRALNDRSDISPQTKARVLQACESLNFVPSRAARSLATGRYYSIAVIVNDLQSTFAAAFLRGVLSRAERAQYTTAVVELPADAAGAESRIRSLGAERLDTVLVAAALTDALAEILRELAATRTIASCWPISGLACDVLAPDRVESGRLAGAHALSGNNRVLYVDGALDPGADQRRSGFEAACRERGVSPEGLIADVPVGSDGRGAGFDSLRPRLLDASAVVASDDDLALALMIWYAQNGRVAGRDVAVIGQGNDPAGRRVTPSLTSVDFVGEEIGQRAAEIVIQRLENARQDMPQTIQIAPVLQRRQSSACLP